MHVMLTHTLHSEAVPPDVYRKKPMCMSQYSIFSKCRIPYPEEDKIRYTPISKSKHVIVMKNGHVRGSIHNVTSWSAFYTVIHEIFVNLLTFVQSDNKFLHDLVYLHYNIMAFA